MNLPVTRDSIFARDRENVVQIADDKSILGDKGTLVVLDRSGAIYDLKSGRRIEAEVVSSQLHEATEIPTYLFGYRNALMRADIGAPVAMADKLVGKYRIQDARDIFQRVDVKSSENEFPKEVDPRSSLTDYTMVIRQAASFVGGFTEQAAAGSSAWNPKMRAAKRVANAILLDREYDVWTLLQTQASWDAAVVDTLAATEQWNGGSTKDPYGNLRAMAAASIMPIERFVMNPVVAGYLLEDEKVRNMKILILGDSGAPSLAEVTNPNKYINGVLDFVIPGLPPISVVASRVWNETTNTADFIITDNVIGLYSPAPSSSGDDIASATTFRLTGAGATGWESMEYRIDGRGLRGGTMIKAGHAEIAKMIAPAVGGLLRDVIQ